MLKSANRAQLEVAVLQRTKVSSVVVFVVVIVSSAICVWLEEDVLQRTKVSDVVFVVVVVSSATVSGGK